MMTISYEYESGLYVNLTNRCDCACIFCLRHNGNDGSIYADDLWLEHEPTFDEALADLSGRDLPRYQELVFCGFGEPMYRIDDIVRLIDTLKDKWSNLPPVRINTNGHGNLIAGHDITPLLQGRVDTLSISLNGSTCEEYLAVTKPRDGAAAWHAMLDFTLKAKEYVPNIIMTVVDKDKSQAEMDRCRQIIRDLGVTLRVRSYIED
ncbi:MAG: TatD family nuclease-associated radical SAM protein [Oscillospiraceae bacterium]|nr:TatD family nuclease-associated radical SAM protein [Oscillospiraceae bacterium]